MRVTRARREGADRRRPWESSCPSASCSCPHRPRRDRRRSPGAPCAPPHLVTTPGTCPPSRIPRRSRRSLARSSEARWAPQTAAAISPTLDTAPDQPLRDRRRRARRREWAPRSSRSSRTLCRRPVEHSHDITAFELRQRNIQGDVVVGRRTGQTDCTSPVPRASCGDDVVPEVEHQPPHEVVRRCVLQEHPVSAPSPARRRLRRPTEASSTAASETR